VGGRSLARTFSAKPSPTFTGLSLGARTATLTRSAKRSRSPNKNLWPEPHSQSTKSDPLENAWHKAVFNGRLTLKQARHAGPVYKRAHGWMGARGRPLSRQMRCRWR
jgi:hypothetical protein